MVATELIVLGVGTAVELIKFIQTSKTLEGRPPEEVLQMWLETNAEVRQAVEDWKTTQAPLKKKKKK